MSLYCVQIYAVRIIGWITAYKNDCCRSSQYSHYLYYDPASGIEVINWRHLLIACCRKSTRHVMTGLSYRAAVCRDAWKLNATMDSSQDAASRTCATILELFTVLTLKRWLQLYWLQLPWFLSFVQSTNDLTDPFCRHDGSVAHVSTSSFIP